MLLLQRIHGLVEMYAMAMKRGQPAGRLPRIIRRTLPDAVGEPEEPVRDDRRSGDGREPGDESRGERDRARADAARRAWRRSNRRWRSRSTQMKDQHAVKEESTAGDRADDAGKAT